MQSTQAVYIYTSLIKEYCYQKLSYTGSVHVHSFFVSAAEIRKSYRQRSKGYHCESYMNIFILMGQLKNYFHTLFLYIPHVNCSTFQSKQNLFQFVCISWTVKAMLSRYLQVLLKQTEIRLKSSSSLCIQCKTIKKSSRI